MSREKHRKCIMRRAFSSDTKHVSAEPLYDFDNVVEIVVGYVFWNPTPDCSFQGTLFWKTKQEQHPCFELEFLCYSLLTQSVRERA